MRDRDRKKDDEMLVTHLPQPEASREGREPTPSLAVELADASLDQLTKLLRATSRPNQRAEILAEIQRRFGNEAAEKAVSGVRAQEEEAGPPGSGSSSGAGRRQ